MDSDLVFQIYRGSLFVAGSDLDLAVLLMGKFRKFFDQRMNSDLSGWFLEYSERTGNFVYAGPYYPAPCVRLCHIPTWGGKELASRCGDWWTNGSIMLLDPKKKINGREIQFDPKLDDKPSDICDSPVFYYDGDFFSFPVVRIRNGGFDVFFDSRWLDAAHVLSGPCFIGLEERAGRSVAVLRLGTGKPVALIPSIGLKASALIKIAEMDEKRCA